jgi:hypothetical protein
LNLHNLAGAEDGKKRAAPEKARYAKILSLDKTYVMSYRMFKK